MSKRNDVDDVQEDVEDIILGGLNMAMRDLKCAANSLTYISSSIPEKQLYAAVLLRAFFDYIEPLKAIPYEERKRTNDLQLARTVRQTINVWLTDDYSYTKHKPRFRFSTICEVLDLDEDEVKMLFKEAIQDNKRNLDKVTYKMRIVVQT